MTDDLSSKLSAEQIRLLATTIEEAKNLVLLQKQSLEETKKLEQELHQRRMGYLREYSDAYSRDLRKIAEAQGKLSSEMTRIGFTASEVGKAAAETAATMKKSSGDSGGGKNPPGSGGGGSSPPSGGKNPKVSQKVKDEDRERLGPGQGDAKRTADMFTSFFAKGDFDGFVSEAESALGTSLESFRKKLREEHIKDLAKQEEGIYSSALRLETLRHQDAQERENQVTEIRLARIQEVYNAEIAAQERLNNFNAMRETGTGDSASEAGELRVRAAAAAEMQESLKELELQRARFIASKEFEARRKNNGVLTAEEAKKIQELADKRFKADKKNLDKLTKERLEREQKKRVAEGQEFIDKTVSLSKGDSLKDRIKALHDFGRDEDTGERSVKDSLIVAVKAISSIAQQLETKIDEIASHKGVIDTRLQGSSNEQWAGSYWDQMVHDMTRVGAINPFFKQQDFAKNLETLVNKGISFDIEQRAFLMTIKDKIATTFEVADGTLLRLIRIQQEDSTAGRLGMESALNAFLNEMYETSEYLEGVASSVRTSLQEMESLMAGAEATEVEYQVQKWLGSLYSVGMSQEAVTSIANALGQITAGQIEGITGGGAGNLLIMAANDANLSIADILTDGIDSSDTNKLLQAVVNYLAELSDSAKDNRVVQQQLANVFGVKASDLKAATNLVSQSSVGSIFDNSMSYDNMLNRLSDMAGSMYKRSSLGEMMTNIWENALYSVAGSMASNPISYFIYKAATAVDDVAGGIAIPALSIYGNMVDLETTVSDLMRVAAIGTGLLGSMGAMVQGLGNSFSGRGMLEQLGIKSGSGLAVTPRGNSGGTSSTGGGSMSTSGSGYAGNASGSDIKDSTLQEAEDSKKQQMVEAQEEEEANKIDVLNGTVLKIYELLDSVANGSSCFTVKVEGYGLTKSGGSSKGALGGIEALGGSSNSANKLSTGGVNSGGIGGSIDLGGWVMT